MQLAYACPQIVSIIAGLFFGLSRKNAGVWISWWRRKKRFSRFSELQKRTMELVFVNNPLILAGGAPGHDSQSDRPQSGGQSKLQLP